ncbi:MAG: hypothetical protein H6599_12170 [Flavobacteriales bacterium]|nr:hypothetical protein [Flavobacteriales bacterium]
MGGGEGSYKTELSPDDKAFSQWLVGLVLMTKQKILRKWILDFETGELVRVFKGLTGTPTGLGFSTDGRYIIYRMRTAIF